METSNEQTQARPASGVATESTLDTRRSRLNERRAQTVRVLAELGFVGLLEQSGLWRYAPAGVKALRATGSQSEQPDQPVRLRRALERLGGTYVKLGQTLSVRPDLVPPEYVAELEKLQDDIEPMPFETVRDVVEFELECSIEDAFSSFSAVPLGSASISQVHAAVLHDGTEVAVKVQRPEAAGLIDLDLELMTRAAQRLAGSPLADNIDPVGLVSEFSRAVHSELDFTAEARNLDRFGDFFADDDGIAIPRVYWDHTTSRLLTESRLDGISLSRPEAIVDSGGDVSRLIELGVDAYLRMIFDLQRFHSDPHPGNLVAMPGDTLGLLDFGRVSTLSARALERSADCLFAFTQNDPTGVTDALLEITHAGPEVDARELREDIEEMMDRYARADVSDTMGQTVMSETLDIVRRHRLHMPNEYAMLFQTLGVLQGVVLKLDPQTRLLEVAEPYIRRAALDRLPDRAGTEVIRQVRQYARLVSRMPDALEAVMGRVTSGHLPISLKIVDREEVLDRTEAIANRFSLTLLVSAMAIALAMVAGQPVPEWVRNATHVSLVLVLLVAAWHFVSIVSAERRSKRRTRRADGRPLLRGQR